jgi:glycosyltransferase involved in cell wall biosynthesis
MPAPRHALVISLSAVSDDPRVLRQCQALHDTGWRVSVAGIRGGQAPPSFWHYIELAPSPVSSSLATSVARKVNRLVSGISTAAAERAYWQTLDHEGMAGRLGLAASGEYDLILCHDYDSAPLADRLARRLGVPFVIDCHEYAHGQNMEDLVWRLRDRPWVHALQRRYLPRAAAVTTVCDGIADLLHSEYRLPTRPTVVRSVAQRHQLSFRPTVGPIRVLYHGMLLPTRGLEQAIEGVAQWRDDRCLIIRGEGSPGYAESLRSLAARTGVTDRVHFEGPVPASQMIARAHTDADIGLHVPPGHSPQKRFSLPNKFFEYIAAGLALCVSDVPEMARLVREHDLGLLVPEATPDAIALAVNSLEAEDVDRYKQRSLEAAKTLNWDTERKVMLALYELVAG